MAYRTLKDEVAAKIRRAIKAKGGPLLMAEARAAAPHVVGYEDEQHSAIMAVTVVADYTEYGDPLRQLREEFGGPALVVAREDTQAELDAITDESMRAAENRDSRYYQD